MVRKIADQYKLTDLTIVNDVINEMFEYGQAYDEYKEVIKAVELKLQVSIYVWCYHMFVVAHKVMLSYI